MNEISLGTLSICIEQDDNDDPASVKVTGPDGTEYTQPWPGNGELNMALGLGLIHVMRRMRNPGEGGGGTDPGGDLLSDLATEGVLWAHYDATDATTLTISDTNRVDQWRDKSGNARHIGNTANRPQLISAFAGLNGKDTLRFMTGGFHERLFGDAWAAGETLPQPFSVVAMFRPTTPMASYGVLFDGDSTVAGDRAMMLYRQGEAGITGDPAIRAGPNAAPLYASAGSDLAVDTNYIWGVVFNGASSKTSMNGAAPTTVNPGALGITNGISLGGNAAGVELSGYVPEFFIVSRALTEAELASAYNYLNAKYNAA